MEVYSIIKKFMLRKVRKRVCYCFSVGAPNAAMAFALKYCSVDDLREGGEADIVFLF